MNKKTLKERIIRTLLPNETLREATSIAKIYIEDKWEDLMNKDQFMEQVNADMDALERGVPIQYVTGKAYFYDQYFEVTRDTLIPRSETEELVHAVIQRQKDQSRQSVLDIGTGTGCIAIILARHLKEAVVTAVDVSPAALDVAKRNAFRSGVDINFINLDITDVSRWPDFRKFDIIVSNPPYISKNEKALMDDSVIKYEPSMALYPEGDDALLFYRVIKEFSLEHLKEDGDIYLELNEFLAGEIAEIYQEYFETEIIRDLQGKKRVLHAVLSKKPE